MASFGSFQTSAEAELYRLVYFGGVSKELRPTVWPYLLDFVSWTENVDEKLSSVRLRYEGLMTEWVAVEAIVRQRDKEIFDAGHCKL